MSTRRRLGWLGVVFGLAPTLAYAVVPASTSLESKPSGMSPFDWFAYGTIVIALFGMLIAMMAAVARLTQALFAPRAPRLRETHSTSPRHGPNGQKNRLTDRFFQSRG